MSSACGFATIFSIEQGTARFISLIGSPLIIPQPDAHLRHTNLQLCLSVARLIRPGTVARAYSCSRFWLSPKRRPANCSGLGANGETRAPLANKATSRDRSQD